MIRSFVVGRDVLSKTTNKFDFILKLSPVIDNMFKNIELDKLENYNILKGLKISGNIENPSVANKDILNQINDYLDNQIIFDFMKNFNKSIDLVELMKYLNKSSISLLKNDTQSIEHLEYSDVDLINSNQHILNLNSQYGIAQFRFLMENYIIPRMQELHPSNGFLKNYTYGSNLSYNLKKRMSYYLDESNFEELEELERGMNELFGKDFSKEQGKEGLVRQSYNANIFRNVSGNLETTKLIDLLTLYNIITNEGKFGGNRASNLFYKDLDNNESISRKFINFEKSIDENYVSDLIDKLKTNTEYQKIFLLKVFGSTDLSSSDKTFTLSLGKDDNGINLIVNRYFTHIDSIEDSTVHENLASTGESIVDKSRDKNIGIEIKCN